jgi:acetylornithine/N-succinyldiaminopimelate aminotransferase
MRSYTFGGNPLATSVGNAVLDEVLSPGLLEGPEVLVR